MRATAAGAAQRVLFDPGTDLLARPVAPDEVPDAVAAEVRRAVFGGHRPRIRYAAVNQPSKWRTVDPIGLVTVKDHGHLLAERGTQDRTHRLSRVPAAEELDEPAQRSDTVGLDRAWRDREVRFRRGGDTTEVLVRVDPARRERLVSTALAVRGEGTDADGRLRLTVVFQDPRHAEWALWEHAPGAEVPAPGWLRAGLGERARAVAALYDRPVGEPEPNAPRAGRTHPAGDGGASSGR